MNQTATTTFELATQFLANALRPLLPYLSASDLTGLGMKQIVATMGWELPDPVPPSLLALRQPLIAIAESSTKLATLEEKKQSDNPPDDAQIAIVVTELLANLGIGFSDIFDLNTKLAAELPAPFQAATNIQHDFVSRFIDRLVVEAFYSRLPVASRALRLLGIIEVEELPEDPGKFQPAFSLKKLHWDRLPKLLLKPKDIFNEVYGWGTPDLKLEPLLDALQALSIALNVSGTYDFPSAGLIRSIAPGVNPATANVELTFEMPILQGDLLNFYLGLTSIPKTSPADIPGLALFLYGTGGNIKTQFPLTSSVYFDTDFSLDIASGIAIGIKPDGQAFLISDIENSRSPVTGGSIKLGLIFKPALEDDAISLLNVSGVKLDITEAGLHGGVSASDGKTDLFIETDTSCRLFFNVGDGDGFLQKILPLQSINSEFAFTLGVSSSKGFYFRGSAALEIHLPLHIDLGPVSLEGMTVGIKPADGKIPVELGADLKASLGPLVAIVQNLGMSAIFSSPDGGGNLGPLQMDVKFKPPNGVGLSIDAGIIKGGGFLFIDVDKGEYVGAMELDFIGVISLKAIGIINTIMPDGSKGFSLLIIITAEFPPIQLGFGFTLNEVGGLLGINRTVKIDVLREGVKTNAIKSILFPQDIIANITRIVSDIKQVFPPYPDHFVVGPMAELGWGTPSILTLEIGILLEIPLPRIAILGVIKALLPSEEAALLRIQVNFLGVIDFQNQYISFDASLFDSRLLIYTLSGDMSFRLSWGDNPMFILSVGGFHPAYHDAPADLQHMTRLTISLLSGDNPRISVQSYFAVTSNTVQFGARAELYAAAAGFNVYGFIGYDVLFQFDPFKFIADFSAGLALRRGDSVVMGISVSGELSGPKPFNAKGDASIDFFFFSISVSFNETWGDSAINEEPEKIDIIPLLIDALKDDRNWKAVMPDYNNLHVSVKKLDLPPDKIVIHPFGVLTFSERLVPLDVTITKFGNKVPDGANLFTIKETDASIHTTVTKEQFAPANFFDKSDNEKLSSPSFELMNSGFQLTGSANLNMPIGVLRNVDYELTYLHKAQSKLVFAGVYKYAKQLFKSALKGSAASTSKLSFTKNKISVNAPDKVTVTPGQYAVANVSDMKLYQPDMVSGSYTEAKQQYDTLIQTHPEMKDQVQILSHFEINMN